MKRLPVLLTAASVGLLSCAPAFGAQDRGIKEADACGYVVDTSGSVVPEATVKATSGDKTIAQATTLSDGSFHFEESIRSQIVLTVSSKGFAPASDTIERVKGTNSDKKCKRPIYVVLGQGNARSFITAKRKDVPRVK